MTYVNGQQASAWFQPSYAPRVSSQRDGNYQVAFNVDSNQVQTMAMQAAPYAPGAMAGYVAKQGMAKGMRIAKTARNARYRSAAYGGRYGTSKRAVSRTTSTARSSGSMFSGVASAVKSSLLVGGLLSLFNTVPRLMRKEITVAQAGTLVAGDLTATAAGGAAGAVASAIGTPILAGMLGPGSIMVTLGAMALGVGGFVFADRWVRSTPFFQNVTNQTYSTLSAMSR